jgi:hypothetical protein
MKMSKEELVYCQVRGYGRDQYLSLIGNYSSEDFCRNLDDKAQEVDGILCRLGFDSTPNLIQYFGIAKYAFEGDYSYFATSSYLNDPWIKEGGLFELTGRLVGLMELLNSFSEFAGMGLDVPELYLVMNMLRPRVYIDTERLGYEASSRISLIELGLLAGVKERTVRNYAVKGHKYFIESAKDTAGNVMVDPISAHKWLLERKLYKETKLPETKKEKVELLSVLKTFDI